MPATRFDQSKPQKRRRIEDLKSSHTGKAPLSAEFVYDSDDTNHVASPPQKSAQRSASSLPKKTEATRRDAKISKPKPTTPPRQPEPSTSSDEDSSDVEDAGEETTDESDSPVDDTITSFPNHVPPNFTKAPDRGLAVNNTGEAAREQTQVNGDNLTASPILGGGEEDTAASEGESENQLPQSRVESPLIEGDDEEDADIQELGRPRVEYKPPSGFEAAELPLSSTSEAIRWMDTSRLEGKQIWHITAPVDAPMDLIEDVSADGFAEESLLLSYQGSDFIIARSNDPVESERILTPSMQSTDYEVLHPTTAKTIHIRRRMTLPTHIAQAENNVPRRPSKVPQPLNLKMRFHPFGVSSDSGSDLETRTESREPARVQQTQSEPSGKQKSSKKRKHTDQAGDASQHADSSPSKRKRRKDDSQDHQSQVRPPSIDGDIPNNSEITASHARRETTTRSDPKLPANPSTPKKETAEERARRKAEKRRRKEAKQGLPSTPMPTSETKAAFVAPKSPTKEPDPPNGHLHSKKKRQSLTPAIPTSRNSKSKPTPLPPQSYQTPIATSTKPTLPLAEFSARLTAREEDEERQRGGKGRKLQTKPATLISDDDEDEDVLDAGIRSPLPQPKTPERNITGKEEARAVRTVEETPESKTEQRKRKKKEERRRLRKTLPE